MTTYLFCPTEAAQSQSTACNTAQTLMPRSELYTGPETFFVKLKTVTTYLIQTLASYLWYNAGRPSAFHLSSSEQLGGLQKMIRSQLHESED